MRQILLSACLVGFWATSFPALLQAGEPQEKPQVDPAAAKMMLRAHQARATWGDDFPGFSAKVQVALDGDVTRGKLTITPEGEVQLDAPAGPAQKWAQAALESLAMHRTAETRESYDVSFANDETDHPLGRLIRFHGGSTHSLYRIKDDVITEVHRRMEGVTFTITISQIARSPEGKTLPSHFNVSYWDAETGNLKSNEDYQEDWIRVGDVDLPERRLRVSSSSEGRKVFELVLSDHKLLGSEKKAAAK